MNIGDLVENEHGEIGIIRHQIGVTDRWLVHYFETNTMRASWSSKLYRLG